MSAKPAMNSLKVLARNKQMHVPQAEQAKDARVMKKRLRTLSKKNKKWAIILGYLAAGATAAALAYAGREHIKIPQSVYNASTAIRQKGTNIGAGFKTFSDRLKSLPTTVRNTWYTMFVMGNHYIPNGAKKTNAR